jgi:HD-GYP domain-containing protein (c-di-GMP phosphodiesterase class II)/DNA-binding CsgD family transcriptional regulator
LSLAADLAVGLPEGHAVRSCYLGMRLAEQLRLSPDQRASLYYAELLMDAGCTAWTSQFAAAILGDEIVARREFVFYLDQDNPIDVARWLKDYVAVGAPAHVRARRILDRALHGRASAREGFRNTCEVAQLFARRMGMPEEVQAALLSVFEQWDGSGPQRKRGELIPITSRIVYATSFLEAFHHLGGRVAAIGLARRRRGTAFDPSVVDAFLDLARHDAFWDGLEQESVWTTVLSMEPPSPYRYLGEERLDDVALAFADFADLKSAYSVGHSRQVAELAERVARQLRRPADEVTAICRAALLHDVGLVTVPSFTLDKPREKLTAAEWERLRLHPYQAERILSHVPPLELLGPLVAAHHERPDGHGYYRGLAGAQIPLGARVIAVADPFDELSRGTPGHPALDPDAALQRMRGEAGSSLCPDSFQALAQELRGDGLASPGGRRSPPREWPAGLTDREVEILRLLATGLSRRQVADRLVLSEHTVRHHLEHIYDKVGVGTRVAATLFAVEHDLLR